MLVIGLGHKARNGKDTAAKTIIEQRGYLYNIRRYAFGDELKHEANQAAVEAGGFKRLIDEMRLTHKLPSWVEYEPNPDMRDPLCPIGKQRTLLQWWGTEYRRAQNMNYWVQKLQDRVEREQPQVVLITDMRFRNEFWWVKDRMKGETVKVTRQGFLDPNIDSSHPSETDLLGVTFDHEIIVPDSEEGFAELKKDAVTLFDMIANGQEPPTDFSLETLDREADEAPVDQATALFNKVMEEFGNAGQEAVDHA